ncbi:MAG: hypothetical protein CL498_03460 [Actinobacteria bacterium]|nr:hypothetical protein [Actinomycetota bacterium]|tara:strand:- start:3438 stop:3887 length:450 start_codon:yes stop_codon:yes gene_type:complete
MNETKETLEILKEKSRSFKNSINKITKAGYTLKTQTEFRMFDDSDNRVRFNNEEGNTVLEYTPKGFETTLIFADNEGREIRIDTNLITKVNVEKLDFLKMAELQIRTERFQLDVLKVDIQLVEYSKGWESFERTSLRDLDKQIEELSNF